MPDEQDQREMPNVLIVDDMPANLQVLAGLLKVYGYNGRVARSGALALQAAQHEPPDIILLDIAMPEMDGYEVCARLKADPRLRDIPVIFISALTDPLDKVKAFRGGGVDYLTKPFNGEEVSARLRIHLEIRRQRRELQEQVARLRDLENLRDNLVHMIVHDLRSPLNGILGGIELLSLNAKNLSDMDRKYLDMAKSAGLTLTEMISTLLDITRMEANQISLNLAPADLADLVRRGIALLGSREQDQCDVDDGGGVSIVCDAALLIRVVSNLVGNAVKFSPAQARVGVVVRAEDGCAMVRVIDHGPGIPAQYHASVFEKFGQAELQRVHQKASVGLGLAFCKLAVEAHGGQIGLESEEGKGSTFWFKLPLRA